MKKYTLWVLGAITASVVLVSFRLPGKTESRSIESRQTVWDKIGQTTMQPNDNGVGTVNTNAGKPVHSIKVKVISGGVNLHKCEIYFSDGSKKEVELRNDVPAGSESREINLNDTLRRVSKVILWYDTRSYKKPADLELWGKKLS